MNLYFERVDFIQDNLHSEIDIKNYAPKILNRFHYFYQQTLNVQTQDDLWANQTRHKADLPMLETIMTFSKWIPKCVNPIIKLKMFLPIDWAIDHRIFARTKRPTLHLITVYMRNGEGRGLWFWENVASWKFCFYSCQFIQYNEAGLNKRLSRI